MMWYWIWLLRVSIDGVNRTLFTISTFVRTHTHTHTHLYSHTFSHLAGYLYRLLLIFLFCFVLDFFYKCIGKTMDSLWSVLTCCEWNEIHCFFSAGFFLLLFTCFPFCLYLSWMLLFSFYKIDVVLSQPSSALFLLVFNRKFRDDFFLCVILILKR